MAEEGNFPDAGATGAVREPVVGGLSATMGATLPPVELWNPPFCGDIGLRIARDGTWFYRDSPIARPALVKLFARILRKDPERYVLVTPVEMVAITVEDAPFLAVEMSVDEDDQRSAILQFRTNVDDRVSADAEHPLRFEVGAGDGVKPYLKVRGGLWALLTRAIVYDLLARAEIRDIDGEASYGVASAGQFFVIAKAEALEGLQ